MIFFFCWIDVIILSGSRLLEKIFHKEEVLYANLRKIEMFLLFFSRATWWSEFRGPVTQKSNHQRCLGGFFSFCQFFIVLHKIRHECIMTLHERFTKTTKKTKHGNVYNDRSTLKNAKNGNQKHGFLTIDRCIRSHALFS